MPSLSFTWPFHLIPFFYNFESFHLLWVHGLRAFQGPCSCVVPSDTRTMSYNRITVRLISTWWVAYCWINVLISVDPQSLFLIFFYPVGIFEANVKTQHFFCFLRQLFWPYAYAKVTFEIHSVFLVSDFSCQTLFSVFPCFALAFPFCLCYHLVLSNPEVIFRVWFSSRVVTASDKKTVFHQVLWPFNMAWTNQFL